MVGAPSNPMTDSPDICRMLAARLGGTLTTLHVPMILSSAHIAAAMRQEPQIAIALVIGVAWGQEKVKAIKACLVGSYISALATDQATAESLLA